MTINNYSTTASNNDDSIINGGAPDGMLPSEVITEFRQMMADQRLQWNDAQWFPYLDGTPTGAAQYVSTNQFKITGIDASGHYHVGRRVKVSGASGSIYGSISAVSYGAGATTVTLDASLINETIEVYTSVLSSSNDALPRDVIKNVISPMFSGNTESGITVTYQTSDDTIDFSVASQTDENFSTTLKTKLDAIAASANNYVHPSTAGNKHIPTGGASGQLLQYSASGTATWFTPTYAASSHTHAWSSITGLTTSDNAQGARTVSTSAPSGGSNGDVWYRY